MSFLKEKSILLVEDDALVAMLVEDMLTDMGVKGVRVASSVADALALIEANVFDAAILDINLKGERSIALAAHLRTLNIPFVFATGYGDGGTAETAGATILAKPYTQEDLQAKLTRVLTQ